MDEFESYMSFLLRNQYITDFVFFYWFSSKIVFISELISFTIIYQS